MSDAGRADVVWLVEVVQRHFVVAPTCDEAEGEGLLRTVTRVLQDGGEQLGTRAYPMTELPAPRASQKVVSRNHLVIVRG